MSQRVHLLILLHGLWGNTGHLAALEQAIKEKHTESDQNGEVLEVLLPKSNESVATYDGIDWGGERIADEIYNCVEELREKEKVVVKLSFTGYSLGGLIARYILGILEQRKFFDNVEPMNFTTIATPHLGQFKYSSMVSSLMGALGPKLLSRTGKQFYCQDKWSSDGRPLIEVLADPDKIFFKALSRFKYLKIYANAIYDTLVPYCTAAIETEDVFAEYMGNGIKIEMEEDYECVIKKFTLPDTPPPKAAMFSRKWFAAKKPRPLLPPTAQLRFPFNIVLYATLPFLLIPAISYGLYKFSVDSKASEERIKQFESEESYPKKLVALFETLEHEIESTTADAVKNPEGAPYPVMSPDLHPIITPEQKKIARWLNRLPFEKTLAFFPGVRNSHALIVWKDKTTQHKRGESVVRHWADHLIL
ncbi:hypothetical protein NP233_g3714 [Leucocoprinus birnbaumii]|uniref:DUF676 domain-containing protein n=1 Tax=Leucocoprinus birnbaumii TaxID=56174 RepID=A0AAD5VXG6_9AGAR|nr:hypothetical protein NP233_g3714 [Leucocoprinus birnbaumii]